MDYEQGESHSAFLVSREGQTQHKSQTNTAHKGEGKLSPKNHNSRIPRSPSGSRSWESPQIEPVPRPKTPRPRTHCQACTISLPSTEAPSTLGWTLIPCAPPGNTSRGPGTTRQRHLYNLGKRRAETSLQRRDRTSRRIFHYSSVAAGDPTSSPEKEAEQTRLLKPGNPQ